MRGLGSGTQPIRLCILPRAAPAMCVPYKHTPGETWREKKLCGKLWNSLEKHDKRRPDLQGTLTFLPVFSGLLFEDLRLKALPRSPRSTVSPPIVMKPGVLVQVWDRKGTGYQVSQCGPGCRDWQRPPLEGRSVPKVDIQIPNPNSSLGSFGGVTHFLLALGCPICKTGIILASGSCEEGKGIMSMLSFC